MSAESQPTYHAVERPLTRDRQAVMDQFDAFCHPNAPPGGVQQAFEYIVDNNLPRRAGFTSLLCDWIARKSHTEIVSVYCDFSTRATINMEGMIRSMDGNMHNLIFLCGWGSTDRFNRHPSISVRVTMNWVDFEYEGENAKVVQDQVIIHSEPDVAENRMDE